ncbi:methyltransferase domain-containing protein [Kordia sp. YSTF-M3]|uniref:Methyltransferase domain-containing protein n=1 Tax=Kordia aestuariivivens TaxID=2759037 RepID=A0ABR7QF86_9FLAO|nr:class I SAM-dependent methyltransferase [Kordia aestuariivivens]MBC8757041.1 methyltransferase domain-containing protein [Kordia aestuariivivens]
MTTTNSSFIDNYDDMILSPVMRELYNESAFYNVGYWEHSNMLLKEACQALVEKHLDLVNLTTAPLTILDVGCGLGATTNAIKKKFPNAKVTGINISSRQISYAQQQYPNCDFKVMDAAQLSFPENHFDLIISVEAVFHFHTRETFLTEAYRVLKKEGEFIFSDVLLYDSHWVGNWSVPKENMLTSLESYQNLLLKTPFQLDLFQDITKESWMGFCQHIREKKGMTALANGLQETIIAYLLMRLKK